MTIIFDSKQEEKIIMGWIKRIAIAYMTGQMNPRNDPPEEAELLIKAFKKGVKRGREMKHGKIWGAEHE